MNAKRFLGYSLLWLAVIIISLAGSYFNSVLFDLPFSLRQELPFTARWIIWIPLTPLAVYFAQKMNYTESRISNFLAYHFSIYLLLCTIHVFAASVMATFINALLAQPAVYVIILKKCALTGIFFNFIVYAIVLLFINGARYYKALQSEKTKTLSLEKSLSDSRLLFLKQQLQPHFLFNTHHSIITLIKMGEKEKAAEMLEKLSDLMRIALREVEEQKVPLAKEIETLQLYVDIQKTRFQDKMQVEYLMDETTRLALVPSMILQPLVENSIKYAVERSTSASLITIQATNAEEKLTLSIKDVCSTGARTEKIKKGTGLMNSEERLFKLYGSESAFSIQPYTSLDSSGMEVTITIPLQYATM